MSNKKFISGAIILSVSGVLVKILGFAFRIPLGRMIGAGGMGDYTPAYDVYSFVLVIATAGIPVAISKLVAENYAAGNYSEAEKVFRTSQTMMVVIGISGFLLLFFGADYIAAVFGMQSSALAIRAISPTLIFAPIMSSYRGYFQGLQNMKPTAISQIVEQLFRVAFGLSLAYLLFYNLIFRESYKATTENVLQSRGAAGACFGATVGALFGLITMLIIFRKEQSKSKYRKEDNNTESRKSIAKKVIVIASPIIIAACIMPIVNLADVTIVMRRLTQAGFEYSTAKTMFGELTGFAAPIMGLPQIIVQAIVVGLVPLIAEAHKTGDVKQLESGISLGYRVSIIITMPCAAGMFALAEPILKLFYGNQVSNAIACLQIYAVAFVFLSITSVTTAMLQGIGKQNAPLKNLVIGLCGKVIVTWYLSGIASVNVKGAASGTLVAYFIAATLDIMALKKEQKMQTGIVKMSLKPFLTSAIMGVMVFAVHYMLERLTESLLLSTAVSIICGIVIYGIISIRMGIITDSELQIIPFGDKVKKIIRRKK